MHMIRKYSMKPQGVNRFLLFTNVYDFGFFRSPSQFLPITPYPHTSLTISQPNFQRRLRSVLCIRRRPGGNCRKLVPVQTALHFLRACEIPWSVIKTVKTTSFTGALTLGTEEIVHYATSAMKRFLTSVSLQHEPKASDVITLVKKTFFARVSYEILYHEV